MSNKKKPSDDSDVIVYPTLQAAARASGLTRQTLTKHLGEIPHRKVGRRTLITKSALTRWLEGEAVQEGI